MDEKLQEAMKQAIAEGRTMIETTPIQVGR